MPYGIELRPYQEEARKAVEKEWAEGRNRTMTVMPTGTGKTPVFCAVLKDQIDSGGRALILAAREELLQQATDKMRIVSGIECACEQGSRHSAGSEAPATVASIQTLSREGRLNAFAPDAFTHIVVDEAHHAVADSYRRVLDHFAGAKILGCTATPDRGDRKALADVFDSVAYEYSLRKAVQEGYLCPILIRQLPIELDIQDVDVKGGDYDAEQLDSALDPCLEGVADAMAEHCRDRKTVVFLPLVKTAQKFCAILNERGFKAVEVNGESRDRKEILDAYEAGEYNVLCNAMLLTEGWDSPKTDCVVVLRPTRIRALYTQMIGRGTRIAPGKEHLLVLDFLWLSQRLDICNPSSLLGMSKEETEELEKLLAKRKGESINLLELEEEVKQQLVTAQEAHLCRILEEMRYNSAKDVDPMQFAYSIADEDLAAYEPVFVWEKLPPTDRQLGFLRNRGIAVDTVNCAGKASLLIDRLIKRQKEGLTTPKQIRFLEKHGFRHVGTWSFQSAAKMIDTIKRCGWQIPFGINPEQYVPSEQLCGL